MYLCKYYVLFGGHYAVQHYVSPLVYFSPSATVIVPQPSGVVNGLPKISALILNKLYLQSLRNPYYLFQPTCLCGLAIFI